MPRDIDIRLWQRMSSEMNQGHWRGALQQGRTLLALLPTEDHAARAVILYNLGVCYNELRQFAEAETQYAEACSEGPGDSDLWYNRANNQHHWGVTTMQSGDFAESRKHFELAMSFVLKAQRINPSDSDIEQLLAKIQHALANLPYLDDVFLPLSPIEEAQVALVDAPTLEERWQALVKYQQLLLTPESLELLRFTMLELVHHSRGEYGAEAVDAHVTKCRKLLRLLEHAQTVGIEAAWEQYVSSLME